MKPTLLQCVFLLGWAEGCVELCGRFESGRRWLGSITLSQLDRVAVVGWAVTLPMCFKFLEAAGVLQC
jgi:hypothetical protein